MNSKEKGVEKDKIYLIEMEREVCPDVFNERQKRIEKSMKKIRQMRGGKAL